MRASVVVGGGEDGNGSGELEAAPTSLEGRVPSGGKDDDLIELAGSIGPVRGGNDGERFREAVKEDDSLKEWRELGERKDRGFSWKNGALVKSLYVAWDEFKDVLVIPRSFRSKIFIGGA